MIFKSFKQYLDFDGVFHCKMICGITGMFSLKEINELADCDYEQNADMFRPMTITFLGFDGNGKEISDFVPVFNFEAEYIFDPRYLQIFLGQISDWHLVKVALYTTGLLFYYYKFDKDGKVCDWSSVNLKIPPYLQFRIDIEGIDDSIPTESYVVTLESRDECNQHVRFDYYQSGEFQYKGEIKKEEDGRTYELITMEE